MDIKKVDRHWILTNPIKVKFYEDTFSLVDLMQTVYEFYNITEIYKSEGRFYIKAEEVKYFGKTQIVCSTRILPSYYLGLDVITLLNRELMTENVFWKPFGKVIIDSFAEASTWIHDCFSENKEYDILEISDFGGFRLRNDYGSVEFYRKCAFTSVEDNNES